MTSHRRMIAILITQTLLLCIVETGYARSFSTSDGSKARSIRTPFFNTEISTARGFGKRDTGHLKTDINYHDIFRQINKFANDPREATGKGDDIYEGQFRESTPMEWIVNEISSNPFLIQAILQKFAEKNRNRFIYPRDLIKSVDSTENY